MCIIIFDQMKYIFSLCVVYAYVCVCGFIHHVENFIRYLVCDEKFVESSMVLFCYWLLLIKYIFLWACMFGIVTVSTIITTALTHRDHKRGGLLH